MNWKQTYNGAISRLANAAKIGGGKNTASVGTTANAAYSDLRKYINRLDWGRIRADVQTIMNALAEAENFVPYRVKMQKVYDQAVLNDQVWTCMERRKDLTLLRKYELYYPNTGEPDKFWTEYIQAKWAKLLNSYALDAEFYGYNLIALGDLINNHFPNLGIVSRRNISPDRMMVSSMEYSRVGQDFTNPEVWPWHIWVGTPTENGRSNVGYGLLFRIAILEVLAKGNRSRNADYNEMYGAPFRTGSTNKQDETEREEFFNMIVNMGAIGAALLDKSEEETIDFHETNTGTGFQTFDNLETRIYRGITKLTLGHGDAVDSIPGKLGAGQGDDNPIAVALRAKKTKDGALIESVWNDQVLPKLRELGIKIPVQLKYRFLNDEEKQAARAQEDESNKKTAEVFKTIKDAGGVPDWKQFEEKTGLKVAAAPPPAPPKAPDVNDTDADEIEEEGENADKQKSSPSQKLTARMRTKLQSLYSGHKH